MGAKTFTIGRLAVHLGVDLKGFKSGLTSAKKELDHFEAKTGAATSRWVTAAKVAGVAAAGGILYGLRSSIKGAAELDKAMAQSTAIMGDLSKEQITQMRNVAREMSLTLPYSAAELARGYYSLASAGYSAKNSMKAIGVVAKFAAGGQMELAQASDLLSMAQTATGLKVEDTEQDFKNLVRVGDALVAVNNLAIGTVQEFGQALTGKLAPKMRQLNITIEEGLGILAAYFSAGVRGVAASEKAYMSLRELQEAFSRNSGAFAKLGIDVYDANGNLQTFATILEQIERAFVGVSHRERQARMDLLGFDARSRDAIETLVGFSASIHKVTAVLGKAGGTMDDVVAKQVANLNDQFVIFNNSVTDLKISLGTQLVPILVDVVKTLADLLSGRGQKMVDLFLKTRKQIEEYQRLGEEIKSLDAKVAAAKALLDEPDKLTVDVAAALQDVVQLEDQAEKLRKEWKRVEEAITDALEKLPGRGTYGPPGGTQSLEEEYGLNFRRIGAPPPTGVGTGAVPSEAGDAGGFEGSVLNGVAEAYKTATEASTEFSDQFQRQLDLIDQLTPKFATIEEQLVQYIESVGTLQNQITGLFLDTWNSFSQGLGDAIGRAIVFGEDFGEAMEAVAKNMAAQLISALVQIGIQQLLSLILSQFIVAARTSAELAGAAAVTYALAFSGMMAEVGFMGPLGIPLAAAAAEGAVAAMLTGAGLAGAAGRGVGAGIGAFAEGGIITRPTLSLMGEAGPEAVIPLSRNQDWLGSGTTELHLELDGRELTKIIVPHIPRVLRYKIGSTV